MTSQTQSMAGAVIGPAGPATGSAWQSRRPGQPRPLNAGTFTLVTLPTAPGWARRYTRRFLDSCHGMTENTTEVAELLVSELVTNAFRYSGIVIRTGYGPEREYANLISLSLRYFPGVLLIEVCDADNRPPIRSDAGFYAENARGLMLVGMLSKEWSYFFLPDGGKVVYCLVEIT